MSKLFSKPKPPPQSAETTYVDYQAEANEKEKARQASILASDEALSRAAQERTVIDSESAPGGGMLGTTGKFKKQRAAAALTSSGPGSAPAASAATGGAAGAGKRPASFAFGWRY